MPEVYSLPQDLQLELGQAVARVVAEATKRRAVHNASAHWDAYHATRWCLDDTMARLARSLNAQGKTRTARLPDEVWCMIWAALSLHDRFSVAHVCHSWRQLALGSPHVWRTLDVPVAISGYHHLLCACSSSSCSAPYLSDSLHANTRALALALPCSQPLTLSVFLQDRGGLYIPPEYREDVDDDEDGHYAQAGKSLHRLVAGLAALLAPHAARIDAIHCELLNAHALLAFLDEISELPNLRSLSGTALSVNGSCNQGAIRTPLCTTRISVPKLEHLLLSGGWTHQIERGPTFPSVRRLRTPLHLQKVMATRSLVLACRNLVSLEISGIFGVSHLDLSWYTFRKCVAAIPHVRILDMTNFNVKDIGALFECDARPDYAFEYEDIKGPSKYWDIFIPDATSTAMLSRNHHIETLVCARDGTRIFMRASSSTKRRTLAFPFQRNIALDLSALWETAAQTLTAIECDLSLWYILAQDMPPMARLEELTFTVDAAYDFADPPYLGGLDSDDDDGTYCHLPAMRKLTLVARAPSNIVVPAAWYFDFKASLRLPFPKRIELAFVGTTLGEYKPVN